MVERSIFIEASNSRWCASPRYRTSHLVVSLWWARLDLNQQCSKATDLQSAALPIPLTGPFIRLGRSNRKLPFSVFFIKVQFPLRLSACLSSNRPCSHSFLINIPVRFVKLLLAPADRIELPPRESESLVLPLYEAGIKQDAFFILLWANKI